MFYEKSEKYGGTKMIPLKNLTRRKSKVGMVNDNKNNACNGHGGPENLEGNCSAILVVGSAGSGKSSTIAKCTGQNVRVGDNVKSVTRTCAVYGVLRK